MDKLILPNPRGDFFKVDNDERKKKLNLMILRRSKSVVALQGDPSTSGPNGHAI